MLEIIEKKKLGKELTKEEKRQANIVVEHIKS